MASFGLGEESERIGIRHPYNVIRSILSTGQNEDIAICAANDHLWTNLALCSAYLEGRGTNLDICFTNLREKNWHETKTSMESILIRRYHRTSRRKSVLGTPSTSASMTSSRTADL